MSETIRFKDLIAEGLAGAKTNTKFYLDVERYRRAEGFKKDGFKDWEDCLRKLIARFADPGLESWPSWRRCACCWKLRR